MYYLVGVSGSDTWYMKLFGSGLLACIGQRIIMIRMNVNETKETDAKRNKHTTLWEASCWASRDGIILKPFGRT